jgi:hypothetical protein
MDNKAIAIGAAGVAATAYCCLSRGQDDEVGLEDVAPGKSMGAGGGLKLQLVSSGAGSTDEMAAAIPDDAVTFTILRQKFGAQSHKFVFIQVCSSFQSTNRSDTLVTCLPSAGPLLGHRWSAQAWGSSRRGELSRGRTK